MPINKKKMEYIPTNYESFDLILGIGVLKGVDSFHYLDAIVVNSGSCKNEIKQQMGQGKQIIRQVTGILWLKEIKLEIKRKIYKSTVNTTATYDGNMEYKQTIGKKKLKTMEMRFW